MNERVREHKSERMREHESAPLAGDAGEFQTKHLGTVPDTIDAEKYLLYK